MVGTLAGRSNTLLEISHNVVTLSDSLGIEQGLDDNLTLFSLPFHSQCSNSDTTSTIEPSNKFLTSDKFGSSPLLCAALVLSSSTPKSTSRTSGFNQEQEVDSHLVLPAPKHGNSLFLEDPLLVTQLSMRPDSPEPESADQNRFCMPEDGIEVVPCLSFSPIIAPLEIPVRQISGTNTDLTTSGACSIIDHSQDAIVSQHSRTLRNTEALDREQMSASYDFGITGDEDATTDAFPDFRAREQIFGSESRLDLETETEQDSTDVCGSQARSCSQPGAARQDCLLNPTICRKDESGASYSKLCDYADAMQVSSDDLLEAFTDCTTQDVLTMLNEIAEMSRAHWTASAKLCANDDNLCIKIARVPESNSVIAPLRVIKDRTDSLDLEACELQAKTWARSLRARSCRTVKPEQWNAALLPCPSVKSLPSRSILRNPGQTQSTRSISNVQIRTPIGKSNPEAALSDRSPAFDIIHPRLVQKQSSSSVESCLKVSDLDPSRESTDKPNLDVDDLCVKSRSSYEKLDASDLPSLDIAESADTDARILDESGASISNAQVLLKKTSYEKMSPEHGVLNDLNMPSINLSTGKTFRTASFKSFESELFTRHPQTRASSAAKPIPLSTRSASLDSTAATDVATSKSLLELELHDQISSVLKDQASNEDTIPPIKDIHELLKEDLPRYCDIHDIDTHHSLYMSSSDNQFLAFVCPTETYATFEATTIASDDLVSATSDIGHRVPAVPGRTRVEDELMDFNNEVTNLENMPTGSLKIVSGSIMVGKGQITASESVSPVAGSRRRQMMSSPFFSPISRLKSLERNRPQNHAPTSPSKTLRDSGSSKWFASLRSPKKKSRPSIDLISPISPFNIGISPTKHSVSASSKPASMSWFKSWTVRGKKSGPMQLEDQRKSTLEELSGMCVEDGPFVDVERDESFNRRWFDRFSSYHKL